MKKTHNRGFTLIELVVVIVVIGFIIGGVLKGGDLINSSKQKKFYTTFIKEWTIAANQYQDRTGNVLADGATPVNNGGTAATNDGAFDNINLSTTTTVQNRLKAIGLEVPTTNTNNSGSYRVDGKYVSSTVVATLSNVAVNGSQKNCINLTNVPTDVALALDTIADGASDAGLGTFRQTGAGTTPATATSVAWPDAQTTRTVNVTVVLQ